MELRGIAPVKILVVIGHVLFAGLFILSLVHWRERVIHVDSAYQVFKWIQQGGVEVEAHRYTAVLPQLAVKVARALGFGSVVLLILASAMHVLVAWGIFSIAAHAWRTPWIAVGTALAAVLCTRLTFYGIVLEANYLLCYPFLLASALQGVLLRRRDRNGLLIAALSLFAVLLVHPVGVLIALFVLVFFFTVEARVRGPVAVLVVLTLLWAGLGRLVLPPTGYESDLYSSMWSGIGRITSLRDLASFDFLAGHSWDYTTHYMAAWVLLVIVAVLFSIQRAWVTLALVLASVAGYVLLNLLTYADGETAMLMEKNFLPLATLIALPLIWATSRLPLRGQYVAIVAFVAVAFTQFRGIAFASHPVHERYVVLETLVADARTQGLRKGLVPMEVLNERAVGVLWALPFETMLLSSEQGPDRTLTLVAEYLNMQQDTIEGVILPPLDPDLSVRELKHRYFALPNGPYTKWSNGQQP